MPLSALRVPARVVVPDTSNVPLASIDVAFKAPDK